MAMIAEQMSKFTAYWWRLHTSEKILNVTINLKQMVNIQPC